VTGTPGPAAGPTNALTDVPGLRVGHHAADTGGYLTGTTVVLAPDGGMVAGVDVRGGGPGTRETDLLHPTASVERVHAIVLTGGSAYGLAAASGAADALGEKGIGLPVGPEPGQVVPIVPAAVLFDLGRGGDFRARPDADFGRAAVEAALTAAGGDGEGRVDRPEPGGVDLLGCVGAGAGAVCGGMKGAVGTASAVLPGGSTIAALVVVNAVGSSFHPDTGELYGARFLLAGDAPSLVAPAPADLDRLRAALANRPGGPPGAGGGAGDATRSVPAASYSMRNTTIGLLATDATLSKAQCAKLAGVGHDGLARALNPVHTLFDGDTLFAVSTTGRPAPDLFGFQEILSAAADVVTRALVRGLLAARGVSTPGGSWSSYLELAPSARGAAS
jgi:putative pantetheine hydrolase